MILLLINKETGEEVDTLDINIAKSIMKESGLNNGCSFGGVSIDEEGVGYIFDGCYNMESLPAKYEVQINKELFLWDYFWK